ncbi:MAG: hypothetical protein E6Q68_06450 [Polynucleobacter sp.]|nr:MAG: hypothetical protein E6Q68_06450 [Polynucleobacter sp.]
MTDSIPQLPDEESILAYVHDKRVRAVTQLTIKGDVPDFDSSKELLGKLLSDMDRVALTRMKMKADEKKADSDDKNTAAAIVKFLTSPDFQAIRNPTGSYQREIPQTPDDASFVPVAGQLEISRTSVDPDEIARKINNVTSGETEE